MIKINKKTKLIIAISIVIILLFASVLLAIGVGYQKSDKVIATVNGEKIYKSELEEKLSQMIQSQESEQRQKPDQKIAIETLSPKIIETLAQNIYLQREVDKIARKSKIAKDKIIQKQIEDYKNSTIRQAYLEDLVSSSSNEKAIKDKYSEIASEISGKKEMHIRHILVATETEAQDINKKLKSKKLSFEQLAKQYSLDTVNSAQGGDLGYVIPDKLDEDFAKAVYDLKKNQISDPIKTKFGWHIVRLDDIRNVELPTFEVAKFNIEDKLKQEVIEQLFSKIVKNAKIKILIKLKSQEVPQDKSPSQNEAK